MLIGFSRLRTLSAALALVAGLAGSASALANTLSYISTPGDYIGQGQSLTFNEGVSATGSSDDRYISVVVSTNDHWYYLDLQAPVGQTLIPGTYQGAVRYPFGESWQPQLSFSGDGRGCNTLTGSFTINSVQFGAYGYVQDLEATFVQNCEGFMPPLNGTVSIHNPPPPPALEFSVVANSSASVAKLTGVANVGGIVTCSAQTTVQMYGSLSQRVGRKSLANGSFSVSVPCGPAPTAWFATVASQSSVPFGQGQAQLDITANAWDPNYGGQQTKTLSTVVNIGTVKHNVVSAKGQALRN